LPNRMSADRVGHPSIDWTQGCIAVNNVQMDQIWKMVDAGTPIEIHP
jgi:L,D-peptidoglycan transpeptidase YkuD (ErfK/YbiS/YcfS/YnhG family)